MNERADGRTDGRAGERTNERTNEPMSTDRRTDGTTNGRTDGRTDERTDGRRDGRADERTDGRAAVIHGLPSITRRRLVSRKERNTRPSVPYNCATLRRYTPRAMQHIAGPCRTASHYSTARYRTASVPASRPRVTAPRHGPASRPRVTAPHHGPASRPVSRHDVTALALTERQTYTLNDVVALGGARCRRAYYFRALSAHPPVYYFRIGTAPGRLP